jgi:hypothetical protein
VRFPWLIAQPADEPPVPSLRNNRLGSRGENRSTAIARLTPTKTRVAFVLLRRVLRPRDRTVCHGSGSGVEDQLGAGRTTSNLRDLLANKSCAEIHCPFTNFTDKTTAPTGAGKGQRPAAKTGSKVVALYRQHRAPTTAALCARQRGPCMGLC